MNHWTWVNIGKPMWLVLKRRGLNKDLRNLFMKRYSQLMNERLLARHTELLEKALGSGWDYHHISASSLMTLLNDLHYDVCIIVIAAVKHGKVDKALNIYPSWLNPDRTWQRKQEYAHQRLDTWEGLSDEK